MKFFCAVLFHFKFEAELKNGIYMMKYVAMHPNNFKYLNLAFLMGFLNMIMIYGVEVINIWNLSNITEGGVYSLMFDFIALGIIAELDDYFFELYKNVPIAGLI